MTVRIIKAKENFTFDSSNKKTFKQILLETAQMKTDNKTTPSIYLFQFNWEGKKWSHKNKIPFL